MLSKVAIKAVALALREYPVATGGVSSGFSPFSGPALPFSTLEVSGFN